MWRSLALIFLGIFLRSMGRPQTYWTFEDTLTQIGIGYTSCSCSRSRRCACRSPRSPRCSSGSGWRSPCIRCRRPTSTTRQVGVRAGWPHLYSGFLAHFNKNSNLSWAFDVWFLNLFPRQKPFLFNSGGWSTLSFIPTLATMILGLWCGEWLKSTRAATDEAEGTGGRGGRARAGRARAPVAAHQPDREADLDLVLHAV